MKQGCTESLVGLRALIDELYARIAQVNPVVSITWANDHAGSNDHHQWVAALSGMGGLAGNIPLISQGTILQTQGGTLGAPLAETPLAIQPRNPASGPFGLLVEGTLFNATVDSTLKVGYNPQNIPGYVASDFSIFTEYEANYEYAPGIHLAEWHADIISPAGSGDPGCRFLQFTLNRSTFAGNLVLFYKAGGGAAGITLAEQVGGQFAFITNTVWAFISNYEIYSNQVLTLMGVQGLTLVAAPTQPFIVKASAVTWEDPTGAVLRTSINAASYIEYFEPAVTSIAYQINAVPIVTIFPSKFATDAGIDLQIGRALVATGGGGAATLGQVGGSGPATNAQNTWCKLLDSAGNPFWVPAWK